MMFKNKKAFWYLSSLSLLACIHWLYADGYKRMTRVACTEPCFSWSSGWNDTVEEGQRGALQTMAKLVSQCPTVKRFEVAWTQPGTKFGGIIEHRLIYDRRTKNLWDGGGSAPLNVAGVRDTDIKAAAQRSGTFDTLKDICWYAGHATQVKAEDLGRYLQAAVAKGNIEEVRSLLKQGAPVDYVAADAHTVTAAVPLNNYDVNCTPLHHAVQESNLSMTKLLVAHGANMNFTRITESGDSPLHEAAKSGHKELVRFLLAHGADVSLENLYTQTPLELAQDTAANGGPDVTGLLKQALVHTKKAK
jgi:hypothetical protein